MQEKIKQIKENKMSFRSFKEFKPFGFSKISHIFSASTSVKQNPTSRRVPINQTVFFEKLVETST
jgi:hypothetical protein